MNNFIKKIIFVFILLSIGILAIGFFYFLYEFNEVKNQKGNELSAITDSKVNQIKEWRRERLNDAQLIFNSFIVNNDIKNFLMNPTDSQMKKNIMDFMKILKTYNLYKNCTLFSVRENIKPILYTNEPGSIEDGYNKECINTKKVVFTDIHENESRHEINLDLLIPLLNDNSNVIGIFQLQIDPFQFLYPMIKSWPVPSDTAESLLVHKEGDYVVFLNELKYKKDTALKLKFDIKNFKDLPAAMAVLGKEGLTEGNDYRNVPVLSCIRAIPNSPWFIVTKEDKKDVYKSIKKTVWIVSILTLLFILDALLLLMFWQRQNALINEKEIKTKFDRLALEKHFDFLSKYANDIIILTDKDFNIVEINDKAVEVYGFSRDELLQKNIIDLRKIQFPNILLKEKKYLLENKSQLFETEHVKKDGTVFPVEVSTRAIFIDDKIFFQGIIRDITERKNFRESIRISNEFLNALINSAPVAIIALDLEGKVTLWNSAAEKMFGWAAEEALGKFLPYVPEDKIKEHNELRENVINSNSTYNLDVIRRKKNGTKIFLNISTSLLHNSNGEKTGIISVNLDVTDKKTAEENLKKSEFMLARAELVSGSGNWEFDFKTGNVFASAGARKIYGLGETDWTINNIQKIPLYEYREKMDKALKELIEENKPYNIEFKIKKFDTGKIVDIYSAAEYDKDNRTVFGIIQDITERKKAEESLRLNSEILLNMAEGVLLIRASDGTIVFANPNLEVMFGYQKDELIGKNVTILNTPDDKTSEIQNTLIQTGVWDGEVHNIKKNGTTFWCHAKVSTFNHTEYGKVWVEAHEDITKRKKIEEEINNLNAELEKRVEERTSQLLFSNKELESFSYSVSHDLRAPLRAIDGFSKVLLERISNYPDDEAKRYLNIIINNSVNMGNLIDDLLNFSRIGRKGMVFTEINMEAQVRETIKDIKLQTENRDIEFNIGSLPMAFGDASMIKIVINNLFSNAVKFTGKREKAIIEFEGKVENDEIVYSIKDNGVGFNMKYIDKIFGVFQRLHRQEEFEGTGIRLALVHRILSRHGGRIWAEAKINEGAAFYFTLPLKGGIYDI